MKIVYKAQDEGGGLTPSERLSSHRYEERNGEIRVCMSENTNSMFYST